MLSVRETQTLSLSLLTGAATSDSSLKRPRDCAAVRKRDKLLSDCFQAGAATDKRASSSKQTREAKGLYSEESLVREAMTSLVKLNFAKETLL